AAAAVRRAGEDPAGTAGRRPGRGEGPGPGRAHDRNGVRPAGAYTCAVFHRPRLHNHRVQRPTPVSEEHTAQNTPSDPQPRCSASHQASGICSIQKNTRLIQVGVAVSPAPLNACTATIHQPYTNIEYEMIRSHWPPTSMTRASLLNNATMSSWNRKNSSDTPSR